MKMGMMWLMVEMVVVVVVGEVVMMVIMVAKMYIFILPSLNSNTSRWLRDLQSLNQETDQMFLCLALFNVCLRCWFEDN